MIWQDKIFEAVADDDELTEELRQLSDGCPVEEEASGNEDNACRVLLVSKDKTSQKWAPRWLSSCGIDCELETDPNAALQRLDELSPELAVVDAGMVLADGDRLYSALGKSAAELPVYVICGSDREISACLAAGIVNVVRKPLDWQLFCHQIQRTITATEDHVSLQHVRQSLDQALGLAAKLSVKLREAETFEPATGLPNRSKFLDLLARGRNAAERDDTSLVVCAIGFARFRLIIDALGQQAADIVKLEVGKRLTQCLHDFGPLQRDLEGLRTSAAGITGSEQFGLALTCYGTSKEVLKLHRHVSDVLAAPMQVNSNVINLLPCIGISVYPQDGGQAEALLQKAESAMREAHSMGGGFSYYSAEMDAEAANRLRLEHKLREAINEGELQVAYQPINNVSDDRVVAVEALLRWPQADGSFISPEEFIPVAEESGLIKPLGLFVLDSACRQLSEWHAAGFSWMRACVNVSKWQLTDSEFADFIAKTLEKHGIAPGNLDLELSERGVLSGSHDVLSMLFRLKAIGVTLSIDDFGTGDSAISYLKDLPVDTLKIDKSYVFDMASGGKSHAIASAMIALGQRLGLTVIAEGVETREHLELLRSLDCEQYQGYLKSPAVAPDAIVEMLCQPRLSDAI